MNKAEQPIGVLDSGMGGISVLKELISLMPGEDYLYLGDSQNAPYGIKTAKQVTALAMARVAELLAQGAKAVVIACNTASSVALTPLRASYPQVPVIGMEPALKPAIQAFRHGRVLVMATEMTLAEQKFQHLLNKYREEAEILLLPAPGIVDYVEQGVTEGGGLADYLDRLLRPYRKPAVDGVVLGCTHFPFVRQGIAQALGYTPAIFDGGLGTARQAQRKLAEAGLLRPTGGQGRATLSNTSPDPAMLALSQRLLQTALAENRP